MFMIVLFLLLLSYATASIAAALVVGSNDVGHYCLLHLVAATGILILQIGTPHPVLSTPTVLSDRSCLPSSVSN